jgi:hypothetical protein
VSNRRHITYGLYDPARRRTILYVGSDVENGIRFDIHRNGGCRTTAKCAKRDGVDLSTLQMRVLRRWVSGEEDSPEGEVTKALQAKRQARWNHPYPFSSEDMRKGGLAKTHEHMVAMAKKGTLAQPIEAKRAGGRAAQTTLKRLKKGFYDREVGRKGGLAAKVAKRSGIYKFQNYDRMRPEDPMAKHIGRPLEFKDRRQVTVYLEARVLKKLQTMKRKLARAGMKATLGEVISNLVAWNMGLPK